MRCCVCVLRFPNACDMCLQFLGFSMISDDQVSELLDLMELKDAQLHEKYELHFGEMTHRINFDPETDWYKPEAVNAAIVAGNLQMIIWLRDWILENNQ